MIAFVIGCVLVNVIFNFSYKSWRLPVIKNSLLIWNRIAYDMQKCLINPFSPGILWKTDISKFSKSSFNFVQSNFNFCVLYACGSTAGGSAPYKSRLAGLKRVTVCQEKIWICGFCLYLSKISSIFQLTSIFHLWAKKQCLYLTLSALKYF